MQSTVTLNCDNFVFVDTATGYDKVWFIGDEFMASSYTQYFNNAFGDNGQKGYVKAHYDVTGYCLGEDHLNNSALSRYRNALVKAINDQVTFPKAIVLTLEQEFIESFRHFQPGFSLIVGRAIEHLANQFHRVIIAHKEKLPSRARKFKYPTVLWTLLPEHYDWRIQNEYRSKTNNAIKNTVSLFREMMVLPIEWDDCDRSYFTRNKLNAKGQTVYWKSVNDSFESWDRAGMKARQGGANNNSSCGIKKSKKLNQYRESAADTKKFQWKTEKTRFKLPKLKN